VEAFYVSLISAFTVSNEDVKSFEAACEKQKLSEAEKYAEKLPAYLEKC
jgi:hypothetical protein